eukprot:363226-Chlamydomonas_euryale.AAC.8
MQVAAAMCAGFPRCWFTKMNAALSVAMKSRISAKLVAKQGCICIADARPPDTGDARRGGGEKAEDHAAVRRSPPFEQLQPAVHHSPRSAWARAGKSEDSDGVGASTRGRWECNVFMRCVQSLTTSSRQDPRAQRARHAWCSSSSITL